MNYFCVYCEDIAAVELYSCNRTIQEVYEHWKLNHEDRAIDKSFQFYVAMPLLCYYCNEINIYKNLELHHKQNHSDETFIVVKPENRMECGLCSYIVDKKLFLMEHFAVKHESVSNTHHFNPVNVSERQLNELLALKIHEKYECNHCHEVFETDHAFKCHHTINHRDMELSSNKFFDEKTVRLICGCCKEQIQNEDLLQHLFEHEYSFECSKCAHKTVDLVAAVKHNKEAHNFDSLKYRCTEYVDWLKRIHSQSQLIFGNGLVLTMQNLVNTQYDESRNFNCLIDAMLRLKQSEYDGMIEHQTNDDENIKTERRGKMLENCSIEANLMLIVDFHFFCRFT